MALPSLSDPRHLPVEQPNPLQRLGLSLLNDERDLPFLGLMASFSLVLFPFAALLYAPGRFRWWLGAIYLIVLFAGFFDRCILLLHNTSHRPLFKPRFRLLNHYLPWVMGPFFGQPPEGYNSHHIGMHHPENNLEDDLSTTMLYERSSFLHFLHYWAVFMVSTLVNLAIYLVRHGRTRLAWKAVIGEVLFLGACAAGLWLSPFPTLVVFVLPYLIARFLMMWGNWGQHAFIHPEQPGNSMLNSITCVNTRYNRRCFNDGYHIGHHVRQTRHWSEMPQDLEANAAKYAAEGSVVFEGIDFFQVSLYLFLKRWDWLAGRFVECGVEKRSAEQIVALLRSRTKPIVRETALASSLP